MTVIYVYNAREHVGIIQSTARFLDWQLNFDKGASVYSDESWWLEMRSLQIVSMLRPLWWGNLPVRPRKVSPDTHAWPNRSVIKPVLRTALFFSLTKISLRIWRRVTSHCGASRCPALPMCVCVCVCDWGSQSSDCCVMPDIVEAVVANQSWCGYLAAAAAAERCTLLVLVVQRLIHDVQTTCCYVLLLTARRWTVEISREYVREYVRDKTSLSVSGSTHRRGMNGIRNIYFEMRYAP